MKNYRAPSHNFNAFNCPHCHDFQNHSWYDVTWESKKDEMHCSDFENQLGEIEADSYSKFHKNFLKMAHCQKCAEYSIWQNEIMIYPDDTGIDPPNPDLNDDIKTDYLEAASIVNKSPRGACALLRLAIEKLCDYFLKQNNKSIELSKYDLNAKINLLSGQDLTTTRAKRLLTQLQLIRIIGNEAVHPGEMDLRGDQKTATELFPFINMIAEEMITAPKKEKEMLYNLPKNKTQEINAKIEKFK
jgi:hypothetical protein